MRRSFGREGAIHRLPDCASGCARQLLEAHRPDCPAHVPKFAAKAGRAARRGCPEALRRRRALGGCRRVENQIDAAVAASRTHTFRLLDLRRMSRLTLRSIGYQARVADVDGGHAFDFAQLVQEPSKGPAASELENDRDGSL